METQEVPTTVIQLSITLQQTPVTLQHESVTLRHAPVTLQQAPVILQHTPITLQHASVTFQQTPVTLQQKPVRQAPMMPPRESNPTNKEKDLFRYCDFIRDVCIVNPNLYISSAELYKYYQSYRNGQGDSNKQFVNEMSKKYTRLRKGASSTYSYIGINIDIEKFTKYITKFNQK